MGAGIDQQRKGSELSNRRRCIGQRLLIASCIDAIVVSITTSIPDDDMMPVTLTNGNVGSVLASMGYRVNAELGSLGGSVSMIASCIDAISVTTTITFPGDNELTVRVS